MEVLCGGLSVAPNWWRDAVVYQVYPRSFADTSGSGVGDLPGVTSRLDYIKSLGVDAIWLGPFYPSGGVDAGYDVVDYCDVDPVFGTLADFDTLLAEAHARGIRVLIDLVPNHSSDRHPLFAEALAASPGSPARDFYHFVDGRGRDGELPPNNWQSVFGGPSWTQAPDGSGQWYYHLFAPGQPDFNWENPAVREFFEGVLRFWAGRGVDGFRIDVSDALIKDRSWPDTAGGWPVIPKDEQSGVHDIYRHLRRVFDEYPGVLAVLETGADEETVALFLRPDEMHQAFNFRFMKSPWDAGEIAQGIRESLAAASAVGAPTTWVIENHDTTRAVTRYAAGDGLAGEYVPVLESGTQVEAGSSAKGEDLGSDLGRDRARAMALLLLSLPGSAYVYAGQELGLPEVLDLPDELRADPGFLRSGGEVLGRDGCRVPLPWSGEESPFGFSPAVGTGLTWLPQPESWSELTVQAQETDPNSMLALYKEMLRLRAAHPALGGGALEWVLTPEESAQSGILHVRLVARGGASAAPPDGGRVDAGGVDKAGTVGDSVEVVVNFGSSGWELPEAKVLMSSRPLEPGLLLPNSAVLLA